MSDIQNGSPATPVPAATASRDSQYAPCPGNRSSSSSDSPATPLTASILPSPNFDNAAIVDQDENDKPELDWNSFKLYDRQEQVNLLREAFFRRWPSSIKTSKAIGPLGDGVIRGEEKHEDSHTVALESSITIFPEFILISGGSGTGKSVLARQTMQQLVQEHHPSSLEDSTSVGGGYCVLGKFDQRLNNLLQDTTTTTDNSINSIITINKDVFRPTAEPYSAFVAALTELAKLWEAQGPSKLLEVYRKLDAQAAGGVDDKTWEVLRNLVPALECVFAVDASDTAESKDESTRDKTEKEYAKVYEAQQDRLQKAMKTFIQTVLSPDEKLILILDDLQWGDSASLELLEALASDPALFNKLMTIGICRSNEVPLHHNFACVLRRLEDEKRTIITNIEVNNLSLQVTAQLVADLLFQPLELCEGVAKTIHGKTNGNCFFTIQILQALYEEGVLIPERKTTIPPTGDATSREGDYHWLWHDELWNNYFQSDNITACNLVFRRLKRLPESCQNLLVVASCLGAEFDGDILQATLLEIRGQAGSNRIADNDAPFEVALKENLLVNLSHHRQTGKYAWSHDRIQQASYILTPGEQRATLHLSIGRALYKIITTSNDGDDNDNCVSKRSFLLEDYIFLVVNQLIYGASLLVLEQDKTGLAMLCLLAGRKAARSSDFRMAVQYFKLGASYLPRRPWRDEYSLCLDLHSSLAEAQCCITEFEDMDQAIVAILANARNQQDKLRAYSTRIYSHAARVKLNEAIDLGVDALSSYRETFPSRPTLAHLLIDLGMTKMRLRNKSDEDILNLTTISAENQDKVAALNILLVLINHTFLAKPDFFPFVSLRLVNITLKYGLSAHASSAFVYYGVLLLALDDVGGGNRYGELGIRLLQEKFKSTRAEWLPKVFSVHYSIVAIWKKPLRFCLDYLLQCYTVGRRSGDSESVAVALQMYCENKFYGGFPLGEVQSDLTKYLDVMAIYKQGPFHASSKLLQGLVMHLLGKSDGEVSEPIYENEVNFSTYNCEISIHRLILDYHLGNFEDAIQMAKRSRRAEEELKPVFAYCVQFFYDAMTSLALAWTSKKRKHVARARVILKKLEKLDSHCPSNLHHKVCLIKAELSLLASKTKKDDGRVDKTMGLYNRAIQSASEEGFLHIKALALERAGVAQRHFRNHTQADEYLKQAKLAYQNWGAQIIVDSFQERYSI